MSKNKFTYGAGILQALQDLDHEALHRIESIWHEAKADLLIDAFYRYQKLEDWKRYIEQNPPSPETVGLLIFLAVKKRQSLMGKRAANALHGKPGGNREKADKIRTIWATGKFTDRNTCAEEEYAGLGFGAYKTAREALKNTPDPSPWPAKKKVQE